MGCSVNLAGLGGFPLRRISLFSWIIEAKNGDYPVGMSFTSDLLYLANCEILLCGNIFLVTEGPVDRQGFMFRLQMKTKTFRFKENSWSI